MRLYGLTHTYFSSVECRAFLNLRFRYSAIGIAREQFTDLRSQSRNIFPIFSLSVWNHSGQCGQHWVFRIFILGQMFGFRTRGDAGPELSTYYNAGLQARLFGKRYIFHWWKWLKPVGMLGHCSEGKRRR